MASKPPSQSNPSNVTVPPSPRTARTLRKFQSHQTLYSSYSSISGQQQPSNDSSPSRASGLDSPFDARAQSPTTTRPRRRTRSNSDASVTGSAIVHQTPKRPARKTGSGIGLKRSSLENLLRDGPPNGDVTGGLKELRYLVLSSRVDADSDGMVRMFSFPSGLTMCPPWADTDPEAYSPPIEYTSGLHFLMFPPCPQTNTSR